MPKSNLAIIHEMPEPASNPKELICRARQAASLRIGATEGPFKAHRLPDSSGWWIAGTHTPEGFADVADIKTARIRGEAETRANAKLLAASWSMASLLEEMASEMERLLRERGQ